MAKPAVKIFIELGASTFRASVVTTPLRGTPSMRLFAVASQGLRRGDIVQPAAAAQALESLLELMESRGVAKFRSCHLMIPGSLTQSRTAEARLPLHGLSVSRDLAGELKDELFLRAADDNSEVIDLNIQNWSVGEMSFTDLPLGRCGDYLSATAFCTCMDKHVLARLVTVCNAVGLEVQGTSASAIASSKLISRLSPHASNRVVVDLGHSTTTGVIMVGHRENAAFVVKAGSEHITKDVAAALNTDFSTAEYLKLSQGLAVARSLNTLALGPAKDEQIGDEVGSMPKVDSVRHLDSPTTIYPWAAPRVSEIFSLCLRHFAIYAKALDGGIVVIGGGSQLNELCAFLSAKLSGVKTTRFKPSKDSLGQALGVTIYCDDQLSLAGFEGLIERSAQETTAASGSSLSASGTPRILRPLFTWFAELSR